MYTVNVLLNPLVCYNCHVTYKLICVLSDLVYFLHNGMAEIYLYFAECIEFSRYLGSTATVCSSVLSFRDIHGDFSKFPSKYVMGMCNILQMFVKQDTVSVADI